MVIWDTTSNYYTRQEGGKKKGKGAKEAEN